jgi:hypothetical protein
LLVTPSAPRSTCTRVEAKFGVTSDDRRAEGNGMFSLGAPKTAVGHAETTVQASVESSYDFVARRYFENYPKWCPQVVEVEPLSELPVRVGTKGRQVARETGIETISTFEVSELEEPKRFEIVGASDPFKTTYQFTATSPETTEIAFTFELLELDFAMRPFHKLISTALKEGAIRTLENIRDLLEKSPARPMTASATTIM